MVNKKNISCRISFKYFYISNLRVKWEALIVEAEANQSFEKYKQLFHTKEWKLISNNSLIEKAQISEVNKKVRILNKKQRWF